MRKFGLMNKSMLAKQLWRISQISKTFKAKYFPNTSIHECSSKPHHSWFWRAIINQKKSILSERRWIIGSGTNIPLNHCTGGVVTAAGLVFAFTMASMLGSDLRVLGQFGSTVCVGLLLDTLIVRTLLMPSIATLLGRWFWWPQVVHPRGDNARRA